MEIKVIEEAERKEIKQEEGRRKKESIRKLHLRQVF